MLREFFSRVFGKKEEVELDVIFTPDPEFVAAVNEDDEGAAE